MRDGKIPEQVLKRSVFRQIQTKRPEVIQGAGVGVDGCFLKPAEGEIVVSSVASAAMEADGGWALAVHSAVNNVACAGAEPATVLLSILLPQKSEEELLKRVMREIEAVCKELNIQTAGGHTEVTDAVNRPVITVTGIGTVKEECLVSGARVKAGDDLVLTKWIALEGTSILAVKKEEELKHRFPHALIDEAKEYGRRVSILPEARVAARLGVSVMHDVSEGGIFGALWELAEGVGLGLEADIRKIPVCQESVEICEYFGLNPYMLLSGGALLICTPDGQGLTAELEKYQIPAAVIGRMTDGKDRVLLNGSERRFLERPQPDEIYKQN